MVINNVQLNHGGIYQCVARNKLGMNYATASLQVRQEGEQMPTDQEEEQLPLAPHEMQDIAPDSVMRGESPTHFSCD